SDGKLQDITGSHDVPLSAPAWHRVLEQCGFADVYSWVLRASDLGVVAPLLRDARKAVDEGRPNDAVGGARRVIERLWRGAGGKSLVSGVPPTKRDKEQRVLGVADALYSLASAAGHDDEVTSLIEFNREDAKAILGCVIALASREAVT